MTKPPLLLTPAIQSDIVSFIRAGGFTRIAVEAAGVPFEVFEDCMRRGEGKGARRPYREFFRAVRQAQAHARLAAETKALQDKPMDWLKSGPGRDTAHIPGWTAPARAGQHPEEETLDLFRHPELQKLISAMLEAITPYPEARAALLRAVSAAAMTRRD